MMVNCTYKNWSEPDSENTYKSDACDSYIANGDPSASSSVALQAVTDFLEDYTPKSGRNHPFSRKLITLCSQFPGLCDDILTDSCSSYKWSDLEPNQYTGGENDENGTNLIDTCGCFLPFDQYICRDENGNVSKNCEAGQGRISRTCGTICGMPNAIKPIDPNTSEFETCGEGQGTTCVIDKVTFDSVDSSNGGFSLTQACSEAGVGPYICYLGNDIDLNGTGFGNVSIQQNCDICYTFDPNDTSKEPIRVNCSGNNSSYIQGPVRGETDKNKIEIIGKLKWIFLGVGIIILIVFIVFMRE
jgi:hypothetical protein